MRAAYSPRKIRTNIIPLYSVLKPDTSSLSPSTKSKGVRILSARQHNIKIEMTTTNQVRSILRDIEYLRKTIYNKKRNLYTISYDTVYRFLLLLLDSLLQEISGEKGRMAVATEE